MAHRFRLPLPLGWSSEDEYLDSLLNFVTSSEMFRNLCGGVHVLDFLTREPDLYSTILPEEWRTWLDDVDDHDFLHLLFRSDLAKIRRDGCYAAQAAKASASAPPESLLDYIGTIRHHCLVRSFHPAKSSPPQMPRHIAVGMKPKKVHEVSHFAAYVDDLAARISTKLQRPVSLVDFGSGQNYLGRTLACPPYERNVIAIERKHHNVEGARGMDVHANLAKKEKIMRNKKEYKRRINLAMQNGLPTPPPEDLDFSVDVPKEAFDKIIEDATISSGKGSITYIEHDIQDAHLSQIIPSAQSTANATPKLLTISLHSCGNLSHHAIRSLPLNPSVAAIAIIPCCYNLLTERLGPPTYRHPMLLRSNHPRLDATSSTFDPHGFPMSHTLESYPLPNPPSSSSPNQNEPPRGVRLNITARMLGVQAPQNWGHSDSESFFTRHFYRALLQKILYDYNVVHHTPHPAVDGNSLFGKDTHGTPLIIGSLRKSAFNSFPEYVRAALEKLRGTTDLPGSLGEDLNGEVLQGYLDSFGGARHRLAVMWSLMAFSAGLVESVIAVDRWLFLREQPCVEEAWVETVFEYAESPRNLCVVGIRKTEEGEQMEVEGV